MGASGKLPAVHSHFRSRARRRGGGGDFEGPCVNLFGRQLEIYLYDIPELRRREFVDRPADGMNFAFQGFIHVSEGLHAL